MCTTCGCSDDTHTTVIKLATGEGKSIAGHDHDHHHHHAPAPTRKITIDEPLLAKNDALAERNRGWFEGRSILAVNLVSSPGAGKTTLLERTLRDLKGEMAMAVVEGDQATTHDAERIEATGCPVVQINTGAGCHLDADMVARGLRELDPPVDSVVLIENVGNLVCPALFDLGERCKAVILSVTEGEDKPVKYPHMFRASRVLLLNKIDLLPHLRFDVDKCLAYARAVNPEILVLPVSATTGEGLSEWYAWLRAEQRSVARRPSGDHR
jgi:hydrogenase nickel incorporation protein HypB